MSLPSLFSHLAARRQSPEFLLSVRHVEHPTAFRRRRKLPLVSMVAMMLSGMRKCVQAELDTFLPICNIVNSLAKKHMRRTALS